MDELRVRFSDPVVERTKSAKGQHRRQPAGGRYPLIHAEGDLLNVRDRKDRECRLWEKAPRER